MHIAHVPLLTYIYLKKCYNDMMHQALHHCCPPYLADLVAFSSTDTHRQLRSTTTMPRYRELEPSSEDRLSLSAVPTCGTVFLHLSAPSTPTHPSTVLSKLIPACMQQLTVSIRSFYLTIFRLCNALSAGFYLV